MQNVYKGKEYYSSQPASQKIFLKDLVCARYYPRQWKIAINSVEEFESIFESIRETLKTFQ